MPRTLKECAIAVMNGYTAGMSGLDDAQLQHLIDLGDKAQEIVEMCDKARLDYLRAELRAERISYGELAELQGLAQYIEPGDVELLEAAGVPEHDDGYKCPKCGGRRFTLTVQQLVDVSFSNDGEDHNIDDGPRGDMEWDDTTDAICLGCGHCDALGKMV